CRACHLAVLARLESDSLRLNNARPAFLRLGMILSENRYPLFRIMPWGRMPLTSLALICTAVFVAAVVSGVFGIAGGMIMLGVLLIFFDVSTAMVLFSLLATTANTWRVVHWWRYINWPILWGYAAGGALALLLMRFVAFVPSKAMVYLILGLIPYSVEL